MGFHAFLCLVLIALFSCQAYGQEAGEYFFYRPAGKVPYNADGVPQMTLTVSPVRVKKPAEVFMAMSSYNNSLFQTGWDHIEIKPEKEHFKSADGSLEAWFAAGFAEGYTTMTRISEVLQAQPYNYSAAGQIWVDKHLAYVKSNALTQTTDPFWVQVRKQLLQMYGMAAGFNARAVASSSPTRISFDDIFQANLYNEYSDIGPAAEDLFGIKKENGGASAIRAISNQKKNNRRGPKPVPYSEEHCSGLVKVTNDDLFISHVTWCGFFVFVGRQYKTYVMETTVSMSSNAILINSGGDWYQTSNKLGVIETTNEFTNNDLFKLIKPECVSEFMRVMVANYLATNAKEWTVTFSKEPSGTYCNQWMVLDYKLYSKGMSFTQLPDNLFWILEAIPGTIMAQDMTWFLREKGYWASYNIPYFPSIYAASGFQQQFDAYGTDFSWSECPRAQIFRRDHAKVTDLKSIQRIMRYNDWENDPLSTIPNCTDCNPARSPMLGISSRGDLVPKNQSFGSLDPNYAQYFEFAYFGATDAKVGSYDMIMNGFRGSFINGPTHDQQPVFSWSVDPTNPLAKLPGMIQTFDFDWQEVKPRHAV